MIYSVKNGLPRLTLSLTILVTNLCVCVGWGRDGGGPPHTTKEFSDTTRVNRKTLVIVTIQ